ncbi:hypothetical protein OKW96_03490 [Sphingobacterium sp. KU25419]|nr:hypothetical protein OKW96_03490 [Sphingobacterium sp. KU25419]
MQKTKADKFNINAIIGFNNTNITLTYLKNCYQLDPANTINAVLLTREVNKIENDYIKPIRSVTGLQMRTMKNINKKFKNTSRTSERFPSYFIKIRNTVNHS